MKPSLVPIACGTALALMAGAAGSHWYSVRGMTTLAALLPRDLEPSAGPERSPATLPDDGLAQEAKDFLAEARRGHDAPERPAKPSAPLGDTDLRMEKLLTLLEGTVEQNQELRDQIAGTNRDLQELRFQVDTYDGQFRPLKVEEEPNIYDDGSSGVLPPLDTP
jgi:hypothetical protein